MRYKEFKSEVEKLGMEVVERSDEHYIVDDGPMKWLLASVNKRHVCAINTTYFGHMINDMYVRQLFHILVKFSQTSIEERHYDA